MKPPRLSGAALTAARIASETPGTDVAIREIMKRGLGLDQLATLPEAWRDELPLDARPLQAGDEEKARVMLEQAPMQRMAAAGALGAYAHTGFWQPMDTYQEFQLLNRLWASGKAPWKVW